MRRSSSCAAAALLLWVAAALSACAPAPESQAGAGIDWVKDHAAGLRRAAESGKPALAYFTADWCVTCKANEKAVINTEAVREAMKRLRVLPFKADYTLPSREIAEDLSDDGRVAGAPHFREAMDAMQEWMHAFDDALFCSWGDYDRMQFLQDCEFHRVAYPFRSGHMNLKAEFARALGRTKKPGIAAAVRSLGMEFEGTHHRGLDDARNIARIVRRVCIGP